MEDRREIHKYLVGSVFLNYPTPNIKSCSIHKHIDQVLLKKTQKTLIGHFFVSIQCSFIQIHYACDILLHLFQNISSFKIAIIFSRKSLLCVNLTCFSIYVNTSFYQSTKQSFYVLNFSLYQPN